MDKKIIYEEVLKLEGGVHRKGFEYVVSAIEKLCNNSTLGTIAIYDELAKEFNDTRSRVERSIRYYITCIFDKGNEKELEKFKMKIGKTGQPCSTEFLRAIALYLKINY